jgi:hypothetical protein
MKYLLFHFSVDLAESNLVRQSTSLSQPQDVVDTIEPTASGVPDHQKVNLEFKKIAQFATVCENMLD